MILFFCIIIHLIQVSGSSLSDKVRQTPVVIYKNVGEEAKISCSHSINNYNKILWYKQLKNKQLQFLGYINVNSGIPEPGLDVEMEGDANTNKNCTLTVKNLNLSSSAVYFCAASYRGSANEAYFGKGTKLTVLGTGYEVKTPSVTVLKPAENECRNKKDEERKKTLLCVATGFYPDHVTVFWQVDGENVTRGVATDNEARLVDKTYTITSRLRVSHDIWFTSGKKFTCIVNFFNSKTYEYYNGSTFGVEDKGKLEVAAHETRDGFLKIKQKAKLSYAVIIAKSILYGAFVVFLAWKLKGSTSKY